MGRTIINTKEIKIKASFCLSRIVDLSFRTMISRFLLISILYSYLLWMLGLYSLYIGIAIYLISLGFAVNFKRVSGSFNLNRITGTLNMSLDNPADYWKYSYIYEKDKISKKLQEEFIDGIINASKQRKQLKMSTHKWMINEVIYSEEIQSRFDIKIIENKKSTKIITEILILFNKEEFEKNLEYAYEIATRERDSFNVVLKRK